MTVNTTMSAPAVGEMIVAISTDGHLSTGMVFKSYATIGVAVTTITGDVVMVEDGTEYANVPNN